ncbi:MULTISPECIES: SRPBCC domain-containing protein [Streptomyces]|uniref:SRPBCC domain-containing protein n=1 Tax=Streptomyces TaxID=1883 RepID=UPI0020760027|nr:MULTISPECIES: SRPBCC domain-containing protein [Streptomyces]MCM8555252.1 SRPBCC domain-containing protein [Streptomyces sp. STCH 565 A]WFB87837.1 SRPBCC domain-containing protein [Streptomyces olivaceus]WGK47440.1 SRPBCC domain-containing protein [Streptomyces sp. B146]
MEHEVFVPVPAERLRDVLADPARVARAVPGLQQDAGAEPVAGRLKVRIGSHSITYRGTLRLSGGEDGTYAVRGDATESRGTGTVTLALTLRVADADGGSTVVLGGTATADGRVTELPPESVTSATARLLTRFAENLGTAAAEEPRPASVFDTEVPPPSLLATDGERDEDDGHGESDGHREGGGHGESDGSGAGPGEDADAAPTAAPEPSAPEPPAPEPSAPEPVRPPAEAAHARRTMIGRSAEEVDHAPPRGRYAPVPAPQPRVAGAPLRWAAPAAALVVASAIVVGRALRRRR